MLAQERGTSPACMACQAPLKARAATTCCTCTAPALLGTENMKEKKAQLMMLTGSAARVCKHAATGLAGKLC